MDRLGSRHPRVPARERSFSSTSGRTRASTAFAPCRSSSNGRRSTSRSASASSAFIPRSSISRRMPRTSAQLSNGSASTTPLRWTTIARHGTHSAVTAWPAKYLIDAEGVIRYAEVGEGGYVAMEQTIRHWLRQAGVDVSSVPFRAGRLPPGPGDRPRRTGRRP